MALARLARGGPVEVGQLDQRLDFLTDAPVPVPLASLQHDLGTAIALTSQPHGFTDGDYVRVAGVAELGYVGEVAIAVLDEATFTYPVDVDTPSPATPAPGATMTATFTSDAQGGQASGWRLYVTLPGAVLPQRGDEILQAEAIQSVVRYLVEVRYRTDLSPRMRIRWHEYQRPGGRLLEVHTVRPHPDALRGRLQLECGEVAS